MQSHLLFILFILSPLREATKIETSLNSKWTSTSLLAETSEFFEKEGVFWDFVQRVINITWTSVTTEEQKYSTTMEIAEMFLDEPLLDLLKFTVSIRMYSPIVQIFQKMGEDQMQECEAFYMAHGTTGCSFDELSGILEERESEEELLEIDHVIGKKGPIVVVYGDLGKFSLTSLLKPAIERAKKGAIRLALRHYVKEKPKALLSLSGYAVELAIRDTEYKSFDERENQEAISNGINFSILQRKYKNLTESINALHVHLMDVNQVPLKSWQLQDLGVQAAFKVENEKDPIETLIDLSQNFPNHARSLSKYYVTDQFIEKLGKNQKLLQKARISPGDSYLFLNGLNVDLDSDDLFQLTELIKQEYKLAAGLDRLGVKKFLPLICELDLSVEGKLYAVDYRRAKITYFNNLETDKRYGRWPASVEGLLEPYYPGMIRPIRKNLFNLVVIIDTKNEDSLNVLKMCKTFYDHGVPLRIGVLLTAQKIDSFSTNAFNLIKKEKSMEKLIEFFSNKLGNRENLIERWAQKYPASDHSQANSSLLENNEFLIKCKLGLGTTVMLNGIVLDLSQLEQSIIKAVTELTPTMQTEVLENTLNDRTKAEEWIFTRNNVVSRLNKRILDVPAGRKYADVSSSEKIKHMVYIQNNPQDNVLPVSMWIVADVESPEGRIFALNAVRFMKRTFKSRMAFITSKSCDKRLTSYFHTILQTAPNDNAISMLEKLLDEENAKKIQSGLMTLRDIDTSGVLVETFEQKKYEVSCKITIESIQYTKEKLKLNDGDRVVIANGLIVGPLNKDEHFEVDDFILLEEILIRRGAENIMIRANTSNDVIAIASFIGRHVKAKERKMIKAFSYLTTEAKNNNEPKIEVLSIIDPISPAAQKISSVLSLIKNVANANIKIILNPKQKISEMPIKRYFRYVAKPTISFTSDGDIVESKATFDSIPQNQLLAMSIHTSNAWMVESVEADHDLDNILLNEQNVTAVFSLENIILEGQCFEGDVAARRVQLALNQYDTIVMGNLGYFQLKANPGVWKLNLHQDKSQSSYSMKKQDIIIDSFSGQSKRIEVIKRKDERNAEDGNINRIWSTVTGVFTSQPEKKHEQINVFSLASGHLYERFLRIMMLSVVKNTETEVKFWLLKNYLSPQFKSSLPTLAETFGFKYELVEYKWPQWLRHQTEKQRIIWGYKILFLDVLFPLSVKKIIFVDADQVVRADLIDLMNFDLDGAPYGFVPFCDSRKEMDGYRFWNSGYWKQHLGRNKYHISALFVVDLEKFRSIAAGDRLRAQYHMLSSDPNSLANLDQDLPNQLYQDVKIKTLPQEWLWCETWCDDDSKNMAKTIDLCNNPLTKEPKLEAAVRIIKEWKEYDDEISTVIANTRKHAVHYEL